MNMNRIKPSFIYRHLMIVMFPLSSSPCLELMLVGASTLDYAGVFSRAKRLEKVNGHPHCDQFSQTS